MLATLLMWTCVNSPFDCLCVNACHLHTWLITRIPARRGLRIRDMKHSHNILCNVNKTRFDHRYILEYIVWIACSHSKYLKIESLVLKRDLNAKENKSHKWIAMSRSIINMEHLCLLSLSYYSYKLIVFSLKLWTLLISWSVSSNVCFYLDAEKIMNTGHHSLWSLWFIIFIDNRQYYNIIDKTETYNISA